MKIRIKLGKVDGKLFEEFVRLVIKNIKKKDIVDDYFANELITRHMVYDEAKYLAQRLADKTLSVFGVYRESEWQGSRFGYVDHYGVKKLISKKYRRGADLQCEVVLPTKYCRAVRDETENPYYINQWFDLGPSRP